MQLLLHYYCIFIAIVIAFSYYCCCADVGSYNVDLKFHVEWSNSCTLYKHGVFHPCEQTDVLWSCYESSRFLNKLSIEISLHPGK